jgi:hypothetical protein
MCRFCFSSVQHELAQLFLRILVKALKTILQYFIKGNILLCYSGILQRILWQREVISLDVLIRELTTS